MKFEYSGDDLAAGNEPTTRKSKDNGVDHSAASRALLSE